jgi:hypothetical protein
MKKEYDFSKGERGKFFHSDANFHLPIYLEPDTMNALRKLSERKGVEISALVNEWIRNDLSIIDSVSK